MSASKPSRRPLAAYERFMRLYHTTGSGEAILRNGFRDGKVGLGRNGKIEQGVWLSDRPMTTADFMLPGYEVLVVDIPDEVAAQFEQPDDELGLPDDMEPYRAFLMPSTVVNGFATHRHKGGEE
jgi:hypothetical protein